MGSLLSSAIKLSNQEDFLKKKLGGMRMNCKVGLQGGINIRRICGRNILVVVHSLEVIMSFESNQFSLVSLRK